MENRTAENQVKGTMKVRNTQIYPYDKFLDKIERMEAKEEKDEIMKRRKREARRKFSDTGNKYVGGSVNGSKRNILGRSASEGLKACGERRRSKKQERDGITPSATLIKKTEPEVNRNIRSNIETRLLPLPRRQLAMLHLIDDALSELEQKMEIPAHHPFAIPKQVIRSIPNFHKYLKKMKARLVREFRRTHSNTYPFRIALSPEDLAFYHTMADKYHERLFIL